MGFKNLKILLEKENRAYLILAIWLLVGYTVFEFITYGFFGMVVLLLLVITCFLYFLLTLISKQKLSQKPILFLLICALISYPVALLLLFLGFVGIVILGIFFMIGVVFWIFSTALFTMQNCYNKTIEWDNKIKNWVTPVNYIIRIGLFLVGAYISLVILAQFTRFALYLINEPSHYYELIIMFVYLSMWFTVIILFLVGLFAIFFKRINLWLGLFFIFIVVYAISIMIDVIQWEMAGSANYVPLQIGQYFYKLYLLLSSISLLISKRFDNISKKIKIRPETIIILLLFSLGMFELGMGMIGKTQTRFQIDLTAILYPILALIFGTYLIIKRSKKPQKTDDDKIESIELNTEKVDKKKASTEQEKLIYCSNCGTQNTSEKNYCVNCGTKLEQFGSD
ncbi:MAG: zinc-ribbon domain-containing protein [Candidatus Hodarchaeota archaeon]